MGIGGEMNKRAQEGFWMVLVPGAWQYLRYQGKPNPTPVEIYEVLEQLGFLKDVDRKRSSILATISNRLGDRYKGLIPN